MGPDQCGAPAQGSSTSRNAYVRSGHRFTRAAREPEVLPCCLRVRILHGTRCPSADAVGLFPRCCRQRHLEPAAVKAQALAAQVLTSWQPMDAGAMYRAEWPPTERWGAVPRGILAAVLDRRLAIGKVRHEDEPPPKLVALAYVRLSIPSIEVAVQRNLTSRPNQLR